MIQSVERNNTMKFYLSYALSAFGFELIMFVMTVHIYKLTHEAFSVGIFTALSLFPRIFSPYYGALIDRYAKNILLSGATFLCGLSIMVLGHFKSVHHIYLLWFVISVFIMFIKNVRVVLMTEVKKKDYLGGNAFILLASNVAKVLSPLIGGIITAYYNVTVMLYLIGTVYLSIAVTGLFIKTQTLKQSKVSLSVLKPIGEGRTYLFKRPVLTRLISTIICWRLFVGFQLSVFVVYVKSYLGLGNVQYGIFMTCLGLGGVVGSLIGPMAFKNQRNYQYTSLILGLHYLTLCLLGIVHHFYLAAGLIFTSYFLFYVSLVGNHSLRDLNTELPFRGRAYGSVFAITTPVGVLSMLIGSYLANIWGVNRVLFGGGVMALVSLYLIDIVAKAFRENNILKVKDAHKNEDEIIIGPMEDKNTIRQKKGQKQPEIFYKQAIINVDGIIGPTTGPYQEGLDISYNDQWSDYPLIISLANSREPLYIVNRSHNAPSHLDSAYWLDKSLDLVYPFFEEVWLRGDTDFSLTKNFDKWDKRCKFIFAIEAMKNLIQSAKEINKDDWEKLKKQPKETIKTKKSKRSKNITEQVVKSRNFKKIQTLSEHFAEFEYQPNNCKKKYRMIVLKKTLKVTKGDRRVDDEIRYFFYITNKMKMNMEELVRFYRNRTDPENEIEQLKTDVDALLSSSASLISN